jgi:hypothetical protein
LIAKRSSVTPATTPTSSGPCGVVTFSAMSGGNRLCIERDVLFSCTRHSSFVEPTLASVKIFSSLTHPCAFGVGALHQDVGGGERCGPRAQSDQ